MKHKSNIKCLDLPHFLQGDGWIPLSKEDIPDATDEEIKEINLEAMIEAADECWNRNGKGRTNPVFNREGVYCDRSKKIAWVEFNGIAWNMDYYSFKHDAEMERYSQRPFRDVEYEALKTLIKYKVGNRWLRDLFNNEKHTRELRRIHFDAALCTIQALKESN